ncbi:MAG TPA: MBL fold metallo-hydrolase [Mammaliicoccus lentus]|nr:MBL fold metallo-hydrolase [Mammaliicoccus lentus]MCD2476947.1 MBL fold metallo-hydrolase [Mammaliicoccus lentus]MCD2520563.1 MBL fold metallo-hydrolase [Mammaliicoccus lentus]HJF23339.1 MBL fold metallo-hydrolase [Mammaliicoccus lentus]
MTVKLKQISKNGYILPFDSHRDRPNLGYIHGEKYSMLIDTGNSPAHLTEMLNEIEKLNLPQPKVALITHWHWDHTFAMHAFNGITIAEKETDLTLTKLKQWQWTPEAMAKRLNSGEECKFCDTHIKIEYDDISEIKVVNADMTFEDHCSFDLGNVTLEVQRIVNPHSEDGVVAYVQEDKILFAGDADTGDFYLLDGGYDKEKYYHYIKTVEQYDYQTYIHGHLEPLSKEGIKEERLNIEEEYL